ncbi:MAG: DUF397 domain-containing protein [Streptosporangiales bacterium]|nr:DUF397 domain-containing protein [Streptosporangiales bacterium]
MSRADAVKPTVAELGIDLDGLTWRRSGGPDGLEVAFAGEWVLLRTGGADPAEALVFDHGEWDAFLRGAKDQEFDDAVTNGG